MAADQAIKACVFVGQFGKPNWQMLQTAMEFWEAASLSILKCIKNPITCACEQTSLSLVLPSEDEVYTPVCERSDD